MNTYFYTTLDKTKPLHTQPHYTDKRFEREQTVFGERLDGQFGHKELEYVYSDRLWLWDYKKAKESAEIANQSEHHLKSCLWYEVFLSAYYDKPIVIEHIIAGVNKGNGYPYYVLGYKDCP